MTASTQFHVYFEKSNALKALLNDGVAIYEALGQSTEKKQLDTSSQRLSAETFKVLVLGEFKRGKSTFINALLGSEILPAYSTPCTAVINEIKWGETPKALLHFNSTARQQLKLLPNDVSAYIQACDSNNIPPFELPVDRIEEFVVIRDVGKDQAESVAQSPFSLVELFWPLDLCKQSVEIIDSPGLNEHSTRTKVTTDYLSTADAIIFVMSCQALASQSELAVIDNDLKASGHEDIFFVCNRYDEIRKEADKLRVQEYAIGKLANRTSLPNGIHFISSLAALEGKINADPERVNGSGFTKLEADLTHFLVNERGRIKLMRPSRDLRRLMIKAISEIIPEQKALLRQDLSTIRKRYDEAAPKLDRAESRRIEISNKLNEDRERIRTEVRREVLGFMKGLSAEIPAWLDPYEPQNKMAFVSLEGTMTQAKKMVHELIEFTVKRVDQEQSDWYRQTLKPMVLDRIKTMCSGVEVEVEDFYKNIEKAKDYLTAGEQTPAAQTAHPLERAVAAAGGLFVGGAGSALVGATLGFNEMLKSLIPNIALGAVMIALGVTNPFIFIAALLGAGSIQGLISAKSSTEKLKQQIAKALGDKIRDSAAEAADATAEKVTESILKISKVIDSGLASEIRSIRETVETVLQDKEQGEERVQARLNKLEELSVAATCNLHALSELTESYGR